MAPKKVFLTGCTGFIGGDALYALQEAQPDWEISVLVRSADRGKVVQDAFPKVKLVIGSLDDSEVIKDAAAKADIAVHTADSSDHAPSTQAICDGLRSSHSRENPGYYIHISGTGILTWHDLQNDRFGEGPLPEQAYDDLDNVEKITKDIPDSAWHREIDKLVLAEAGKDPAAVKVAIISPPTIYGMGRGPSNKTSRQIPLLISLTLENGAAPVIGRGLTEWDHVHVSDLAAMIVLLAQQANLTKPDPNESEIFGPKGYHFCALGTHKWSDVATVIAKEGKRQGLMEEDKTESLDFESAKEKYGFETATWGLNSKGAAKRARKYLGWKPTAPALEDTIPDEVRHQGELKTQGKRGGFFNKGPGGN